MWILQLNDMRAPKIEIINPVARAETKEELETLIKSESVDRYQDGNWGKTFKKGGPLEWYNHPFSTERTFVDVGDEDLWAEKTREDFQMQIMSIPEIN